jgi:hypothetical protein
MITFAGRAGYTLFGSPNLEGRLTLKLPGAFRVACGGAIAPTRMGGNDRDETHFAVTLERVIRTRGRSPTGVFYLGFRSGSRSSSNDRHENLIVAGLARSW